MITEMDDRTFAEDPEESEKRWIGIYNGVVVNNRDPLGIGRVRARVQGLIELTGWALPVATGAGGAEGVGDFHVPPEGADVVVMFLAGSVNDPIFMGAHWGEGERPPGPSEPLAAADRANVRAIETSRYLIVMNPAEPAMRLLDKTTGAQVALAGDDVLVSAPGAATLSGARVDLASGAQPNARQGDTVQVTIPAGTVAVPNPSGVPPTIPNPVPIQLSGTVTGGSSVVFSG